MPLHFPLHVRLATRVALPATLLLALAGCTTVNNLPPSDAATGMPAGRAPVVDASVNSAGMPVASPQVAAPDAYTPPPAAATAAPLAGLHLQAGAFANPASAESVAAHIRSKVPSMAQRVAVQPRGALFRVVIGPFASEAERMEAARQIHTLAGNEAVNAAP